LRQHRQHCLRHRCLLSDASKVWLDRVETTGAELTMLTALTVFFNIRVQLDRSRLSLKTFNILASFCQVHNY
jgi:hypothetical protein